MNMHEAGRECLRAGRLCGSKSLIVSRVLFPWLLRLGGVTSLAGAGGSHAGDSACRVHSAQAQMGSCRERPAVPGFPPPPRPPGLYPS